jgi:hypothetical protein
MDSIDLESPVDGGIATVNFFNGRLLTANDLRREQQARRDADTYLGRALGDGVALGLAVKKHPDATATNLLVTVDAGLAINPAGQALRLARSATITLVRKAKQIPVTDVTTFTACGPQNSGTYVAGAGVYLLTIAPATASNGKAPTGGFDAFGGKCNTDAFFESVQFRLLPMDLASVSLSAPGPDARAESLFRNALAAACLSTGVPGHDNPFAGADGDRVADLFDPALSDCDVPLALVYTTQSGGIRFIDAWSVRRRVRSAVPPSAPLVLPGDRAVALGEARLLQFSAHLDELLRPDLHPETQRIQDYFRYVPAAAYFPVLGPGFSRGVTPAAFLGSFVRDLPDRMEAGMASALLGRAYAFSLIDLSDQPCLQSYEIEADSRTAAGAAPAQRFQLFASRRLAGPPSNDAVTSAFRTAWDVYRSLVRRRVFIPLGATAAEIAAQITLVGAIRDVMDMANLQSARASVSGLDEVATREAFQSLYNAQQDLATLCASPLPDVTDDQGRASFGASLTVLVDGTPPDGKLSLAAALSQGSACAMVGAQDTINQFIAGWSGDGVAVGPVTVTEHGSPNGRNLVPGGDWFPHKYRLLNGTDRRLTFQLTATASAVTGSWQNAAEVHHATTGALLTGLEVPSGTSVDLEIRVRAPGDAMAGEIATLTFNVRSGAPNDRDITKTLDLNVAAAAGPAVNRTVSFDGPALTPNGENSITAAGGRRLNYGFNVLYTAPEGPAQADFDFVVTFTAGTIAGWVVAIAGTMPSPGGAPPESVSGRRQLAAGDRTQIFVGITTPAVTVQTSIQFIVSIHSSAQTPAFQADLGQTLSITVTPPGP